MAQHYAFNVEEYSKHVFSDRPADAGLPRVLPLATLHLRVVKVFRFFSGQILPKKYVALFLQRRRNSWDSRTREIISSSLNIRGLHLVLTFLIFKSCFSIV